MIMRIPAARAVLPLHPAVWIISLLMFFLAGCDAMHSEAPITRFEVRGTALIMNAGINSRTPAAFNMVMAANPQIRTLVLEDIPGSFDDDAMFAMGYRVRALGLNTHLTSRSRVHSGGVDLFLAGVRRTMEPGAELGVHSWTDGTREARDFPRRSMAHNASRAYMRKMLGSDDFYWFAIYAASADDMYILKPWDIRRFGLLTY